MFLFNDKGEILLQVRARHDETYPGHWDAGAGGGVDAEEDYQTAARRELQEELGIQTNLQYLGKDLFEYKSGKKQYIGVFKGMYNNNDFIIDPDEIEGVRFLSAKEIQEMIQRGEPFHPDLVYVFKKYFYPYAVWKR